LSLEYGYPISSGFAKRTVADQGQLDRWRLVVRYAFDVPPYCIQASPEMRICCATGTIQERDDKTIERDLQNNHAFLQSIRITKSKKLINTKTHHYVEKHSPHQKPLSLTIGIVRKKYYTFRADRSWGNFECGDSNESRRYEFVYHGNSLQDRKSILPLKNRSSKMACFKNQSSE